MTARRIFGLKLNSHKSELLMTDVNEAWRIKIIGTVWRLGYLESAIACDGSLAFEVNS